jgi:AAA15 family ATPase/GTPase
MLIKFAVKNFRGFAERIEWDLSHPSNYTFNPNAIKDGVIKNGIIYGPNGAGKSNLGIAIFDIVNHLTQKYKSDKYYKNFTYGGDSNLNVLFEYTFMFGKQKIDYQYQKNSEGILVEESLTVDGTTVFNRKRKYLELDEKQFPINPNAKANLQANVNNISIVNYLLTSYPLTKNHYLIKLRDFVESMLWFRCLGVNEFMGFESTPTNIDEFIIKNNLINDFSDFLYKVSGQKYEFDLEKSTDKLLFWKAGSGSLFFDTTISTGTQSLHLLYYWLKKIGNASFVFIDEFDAFYHFKLAFEVCKQLFDLNCQVFMSSHNTYLLTNDLLRPDCNFILQNNTIKPLQACTEKELRFAHNIEKIYRAGAFHVE